MTGEALAAVVTAMTALVLGVWNAGTSSLSERKLEELKSTLTDRNSEEQARRDYRYEALKRLYEDVEPLLFQMRDPMASAFHQVQNFCRASRDGVLLAGPSPWLADAYYMNATIYRLMLPAAYYELVRERLSMFDLSLDTRIAMVHGLLLQYTRAMRADYRLGDALYGEGMYRPQAQGGSAIGRDVRQGVLAGMRDNMAQAMLADIPGPGAPRRRVLRFGEFEEVRAAQPARFAAWSDLFTGFEAPMRPILCGVLMELAALARLLSQVLRRDVPDLPAAAVAVWDDPAFRAEHDFGQDTPSPVLWDAARTDFLDAVRRAAVQAE